MRTQSKSCILFIILFSCVDRVEFDLDLPNDLSLVIEGRITNQPGPYQVKLSTSFDTQSDVQLRQPVSVKRISISDENGIEEPLEYVREGLYQTNPFGLQGRIDGVYTLRVELFDGRVYESVPDTLLAPGQIETLFYEFNEKPDLEGIMEYGFDVLVDANGNNRVQNRYLWNYTGTFKSITHPERDRSACYPIEEQGGKCNFLPLCTGLRNNAPWGIIPSYPFNYDVVGPCECCTCWYNLYTNVPILSDNLFSNSIHDQAINIARIPLNQWIFMFKIHVEVSQLTLTENAYRFFSSIREQQEAIGSLFQPITGKIPQNFIQKAGVTTPVSGLFYAAGIDSQRIYITPEDVPNQNLVPKVDFNIPGMGAVSCLELFPHSTNVKPAFWED